VLATYIGSISALIGVLLGGALTTSTQRRIHKQGVALQTLHAKQEAAVEFLSTIRAFRRFAMYSTAPFDEVEPTESSKGVVSFEGRYDYDIRLDAAYARLMIVVHSDDLNRTAHEMRSALNKFFRERECTL
jgi:hypothetical protein